MNSEAVVCYVIVANESVVFMSGIYDDDPETITLSRSDFGE